MTILKKKKRQLEKVEQENFLAYTSDRCNTLVVIPPGVGATLDVGKVVLK